jgi:hypothetical protein
MPAWGVAFESIAKIAKAIALLETQGDYSFSCWPTAKGWYVVAGPLTRRPVAWSLDDLCAALKEGK